MFEELSTISLADWLKISAVIVAAIGLFLNAWQQRRSNNQHQTEQVADVLWKMYDDKELSEIYYQIEYHEFKYDSSFHGSDVEKKLDKLIATFDILAKQYFIGLVKLKDLELVSYEYLMIYQNREIHKYFKFLDGWFSQRGIKNPPFSKFRELGEIIEKHNFMYAKHLTKPSSQRTQKAWLALLRR